MTTVYTDRLGPFDLRVFPDRDWLVVTRHGHNGSVNSLGMTSAELTDAVSLLNTGHAWLADNHNYST